MPVEVVRGQVEPGGDEGLEAVHGLELEGGDLDHEQARGRHALGDLAERAADVPAHLGLAAGAAQQRARQVRGRALAVRAGHAQERRARGEVADLELGEQRQARRARGDGHRVRDRDARAPHHEVAPLEGARVVRVPAGAHALARELAAAQLAVGPGQPRVGQAHVEPVPREQPGGGETRAGRPHHEGALSRAADGGRRWSLELEGREREQGQQHAHDVEAQHHAGLRPALELEMVVERRHAEDAPSPRT